MNTDLNELMVKVAADNTILGKYVLLVVVVLLIVAIWDIVWKLLAMWRASKRNEPVWFVLIMIINSMGIVPILYLIFTKEPKKENVKKKNRRNK